MTFLRAINVAGHAIVKMADLKDAFASAGCRNVGTFIQSGNVIFESAEKKTALFRNIQTELRPLIGDQSAICNLPFQGMRLRSPSNFVVLSNRIWTSNVSVS